MIDSKQLEDGVGGQKLVCRAEDDRFFGCKLDGEKIDFSPDKVELKVDEEDKVVALRDRISVNPHTKFFHENPEIEVEKGWSTEKNGEEIGVLEVKDY